MARILSAPPSSVNVYDPRVNAMRLTGLLGGAALAAALLPRPASAQIDLSGEWSNIVHEDMIHRRSMLMGDYTGVPLNEAGRRKAESWDQAVQATHERQCIPHVVTYSMRGFTANMRISTTDDPQTGRILAYTIHGTYGRPRTIWMDGRPHPSQYAPHTWAGFSTGEWVGNALVVTTTHIKMGWVLRNGAPTSDRAEMTEHYIRHGNRLLGVLVVNDPVYLSEPLVRTQDWVQSPGGQPNAWGPCGPAEIVDELPNQTPGHVPHYLPGENVHLAEFPERYGIPVDAARGGAMTTYPEYVRVLRGERPASGAAAPSSAPGADPDPSAPGELELMPVQGSVYMLAGAGGNVAIQIGDDGALLVDAGLAGTSDAVLAAVQELTDKPIRFVVNTHAHPDHTGGNEAVAQSGRRIADGLLFGGRPGAGGAMVLAHEGTLNAMALPRGGAAPAPAGTWPTDTYAGASKEIYANGEALQLLHQPAAHTGGDSLVYFRRSDVIVSGDIYRTTGYPIVDNASGGSLNGVIAGLNRIIELTIPKDWQEGGTMVLPGHGRLADEADVVEYRDMVTIIRDRIESLIDEGMTLEQVKAARPTLDYDGRYGSTAGPWTTEMFVEAAYRDLSGR